MSPDLMAWMIRGMLADPAGCTYADRAEFRAYCIRELRAKSVAVDPHATLPMIAHLCELIAGMRQPSYVPEPAAIDRAA